MKEYTKLFVTGKEFYKVSFLFFFIIIQALLEITRSQNDLAKVNTACGRNATSNPDFMLPLSKVFKIMKGQLLKYCPVYLRTINIVLSGKGFCKRMNSWPAGHKDCLTGRRESTESPSHR